MREKQSCMSQCIAFRYVVDKDIRWKEGIAPKRFEKQAAIEAYVKDADDIDRYLGSFVNRFCCGKTAILLSGGIDSAIIASYLPEGTPAYTIRFLAEGAVDESVYAAKYAQRYKLEHHIVDVAWEDYETLCTPLMKNKNAPLHPVEVALYKAAAQIRADGYGQILIGNGADSNFGGMDKLLSRDWSYGGFIQRYNFADPEKVLKEPEDVEHIYAPYKVGQDGIDVAGFLHDVHGYGIIEAFENALSLAGCSSLEPYENMKLAVPLDMHKIRNGQSKYLLRELFSRRYPEMEGPEKVPFARPMEQWLKNWQGPQRPEFNDIRALNLTGEQKWLVYCLERFLHMIDA